ncbi:MULTISPECIES: hypothetical protein [unclassified Bradyrhizobium]|uniref:hypothetical protein n=1 Tax=unclassified Bradyrhizobium TaxID=2631580 RepID=UPI000418E709|nr:MULTISPECIES: hypothetical protein [unclassified Bradyrhizobium]MCP3459517.1 hypothetical protein [Bradyrhizobium sp. CCGUVB23]
MTYSNHGIVRDKRAEEQPRDKQRAQTVHKSGAKGSPSKEATRDPELNDQDKTPGSGMTPDDSGTPPTG